MAWRSRPTNTERDLAFLIVQFLDEHNLTESARTLEKEAKLKFNMKYVEEAVKDGKWKELENYVLAFTRIDENPWSTKMILEIRSQKNIEAALDKENEKIGNARRSVFANLKMMIEMNPVLKDKLNYPILEDSRLKVLMNHSLNWQHLFCEYPEANPEFSTLYDDHTCGDAVVLSSNDGV